MRGFLLFKKILITYIDGQICPRVGQWEPLQAGLYVFLTRPHHFLSTVSLSGTEGSSFNTFSALSLKMAISPSSCVLECLFLYNLAKSDFLYCLIFANLIGEKQHLCVVLVRISLLSKIDYLFNV